MELQGPNCLQRLSADYKSGHQRQQVRSKSAMEPVKDSRFYILNSKRHVNTTRKCQNHINLWHEEEETCNNTDKQRHIYARIQYVIKSSSSLPQRDDCQTRRTQITSLDQIRTKHETLTHKTRTKHDPHSSTHTHAHPHQHTHT